jgi:hypothetical protein
LLKPSFFYLSILGFVTLASLGASIWAINALDPEESVANVAIFYASSGMFVLAASAMALFSIRQRFGVREMVQKHFKVSLRQGTWGAVLYIAAMVLQANGLLTWLNSAFLLIALTFLETYFLYNDRKNEIETNQ